uniref:HU family DNA-binding protein n=1 Tax=candidate division WOR-3 bacterium TaxID=2052148 RepID=A0A7C4YG44_UNCW3
MNKKQMIEQIAKEAGISKKQAQKSLDAVIGNITKALKKGEKVTLVGFGTFAVRKRKARQGRNPRNGQIIKIPAKKVPVFKAGNELKKAVS